MIVRACLFLLVLSTATAVNGSSGSGFAFSRGAAASRMQIGMTYSPAALKTDLRPGESGNNEGFVGVYVVTAFDPDPTPVTSVISDNSNGGCSTLSSPGESGYCSVIGDGGALPGGNGTCSVKLGNTFGQCSIGASGQTTINCSVKFGGECSVATIASTSFCSTRSLTSVGMCSVVESRGDCSVMAGSGKCSVKGSAEGESGYCSVKNMVPAKTVHCSVLETAGGGNCSAFGTGDGERFCSVTAREDGNAACTVFSTHNDAKCSVHDAGDPADSNTKCSVKNGSEIIPPNGEGKCIVGSGGGGSGAGMNWWLQMGYSESYVQTRTHDRGIEFYLVSSVALLMIGLGFVARSKQ